VSFEGTSVSRFDLKTRLIGTGCPLLWTQESGCSRVTARASRKYMLRSMGQVSFVLGRWEGLYSPFVHTSDLRVVIL
jgi:hypothetical protein